ncbi:MAG: damage-inducible protein DinB [Chitinophagaceae bacterium]
MQLSHTIIPELQQEAAATRKVLERVPLNDQNWKPHEKSMIIGKLAPHVAELPGWITMRILTDGLDFATSTYKSSTVTSNEELVSIFDENVKKAIETLEGASNETLMGTWTQRNGEEIIFSLTKLAVIRS